MASRQKPAAYGHVRPMNRASRQKANVRQCTYRRQNVRHDECTAMYVWRYRSAKWTYNVSRRRQVGQPAVKAEGSRNGQEVTVPPSADFNITRRI